MTDQAETEALELRQRLQDQEERLRLALAAARMGTWEHTPGTGVVYWDSRSKAILGLREDEEFGMNEFAAAIHAADRDAVFAGITKAMDPAGPGECSLQYRITTAQGLERWVEAHGRCVFLGGVAARINGTLLDITERKQADEAIRDAAQRKDEFVALLGHELRNPLAPIRTALELMGDRHPDLAVRERDVIDRQLKHVTRLVDDLLDMARFKRGAGSLKRELVDLLESVQRAIELASPALESKGHRLTLDVPAGLKLSLDPVRFSQIVSNLLTNAAKFTPQGGRITVSARQSGSEVTLEISDTGAGIAVAQLQRIFEPFVQLEREGGTAHGLGLGLSLVKDLVGLHGGRVQAYSNGLGHGSRFVVLLPLALATESEPPKVERRIEPAPPSGRRILLVDDNEDAAEMMSLILTQRGHRICVAHDGPSALQLAPQFEPEIAVLDLGLPIMDGYELAGRLLERQRAPRVRLIALTGYGQAEDRARTHAAGFDAHLVKPVNITELEAALHHVSSFQLAVPAD